MDIVQYSNGPPFQGIKPVTQQVGNYNLSVQEIALSMRQHLFDPTSSTTTNGLTVPETSLHYHQVGLTGPSPYLNSGIYFSDDDVDDTKPCLGVDDEIVQDQHQRYQNESINLMMQHERPSTSFVSDNVNESTVTTSSKPHCQMVHGNLSLPVSDFCQQNQEENCEPGRFQDGKSNDSIPPDINYPRLKSKFYEDLLQKYPKLFKKQSSTNSPYTQNNMSPSTPEHEESCQGKNKDMSPRYLPRPPNESPRTITRNTRNLREAARLLLNRSRQNLSSLENDGEKSMTDSPNSVKDRLRENKERMKELLTSPGFGKYKEKKHNSKGITSEKQKLTNGIHKELRNSDILRNSRSLQTGFDSVSDSGIDGTGQSTSRSVDSCPSVDQMVGSSYQLRRHASGGCLVESRNGQNNEAVSRGYHTADSDTDSGISRSDHSWHGSNRRGSSHHKQLPPSTEALRMLQKRRDSYGSQNGSAKKPVMGPLKADHNIQPCMKADESPKANRGDPWVEQGARPKRSSSAESLTMESEIVRHEYFYDTPIRNDSNPPSHNDSFQTDNESLSDISDYSNPAYRGRQDIKSNSNCRRTESPCRSVRFEDTDSDGYRPRSRSSSHNGSILKEPSEPKRLAPSLKSHPRRHSSYNSHTNPVCEINHENEIDSKTHKRKGASYSSSRSSLSHQDSDDLTYSGNKMVKSMSKGRENAHRNRTRSSSLDRGAPDRGRKNTRSNSRSDPVRDALSRISANHPPEPVYAKVDKSRKHRSSSQPPERRLTPSRQMVGMDSWSISSNPCINDVFDDGLLNACEENSWDSWIGSDLSRQSNLSGSRSSLASRASISERMSSLGRATKKKFSSMRRALSLDRIDKAGTVDEPPKMRKSPSLRSITTSLGKKFKRSASSSDIFSRERSGSTTSFSSTSSYTRPRRATIETDVTGPTHLRKVGRLLQLNEDGSQVIELVKPPSGPFGFYIAKGKCNSEAGVFVTRLSDGHPEKILLGLIHVGDEILSINDVSVNGKSIDDVYDIILENERLVIKILPLTARS